MSNYKHSARLKLSKLILLIQVKRKLLKINLKRNLSRRLLQIQRKRKSSRSRIKAKLRKEKEISNSLTEDGNVPNAKITILRAEKNAIDARK